MLKISAPYIRETAVRDDKEGKHVVIQIPPPGTIINFRLRYGRQTWSLPLKDCYMAARYGKQNARDVIQQMSKKLPAPSVKDEIQSILHAQGKLNIAQVLQQLKQKRITLSRAQAGEWLETLKEMGKVKQTGFSYELVK